jgi:CheY-like chemotaxis protein
VGGERVLVVEDSQLLAALLADALRAHGVGQSVSVHSSAEAAWTAFQAHADAGGTVGLLVVDITLPGEDGLAFGRRVRERERALGAAPAPMVFFSSREIDAEINAAVADCFPARYVQKQDEQGPAAVALEGARMMRKLVGQS